MFDISFSELLVIAFVALVVIGPEKLPKVARTAGAFFGRLQRLVTQVKDEVNRESRFAELQTLQQEMQSSLKQGYDDIEQSILPVASPPPAVEVKETPAPVKKPRKPRQRKASVEVDAASALDHQQEALVAELSLQSPAPQAELFAMPEAEPKKTRRPRKTAKKADDTTASVSEQKPLA